MGWSVYHLYIFIHYNGSINIPLLKGSQSVTIIMNYSATAHGCTGWTKHLEPCKENRGQTDAQMWVNLHNLSLLLLCDYNYALPLCERKLPRWTKNLHCRSANWFDHREICIQLSHLLWQLRPETIPFPCVKCPEVAHIENLYTNLCLLQLLRWRTCSFVGVYHTLPLH